MIDYLRYYFPVGMFAAAFLGFALGGNWVWLGLLTFPTLALVDTLLPYDFRARSVTNRKLANIPVWICALAGPGLYLMAAWWVFTAPEATAWQYLGAAFSCGWLSVLPLVPATHELYHQRGRLHRLVGRYAQVCYFDATREIAHVVGHHINVGTSADSDTARRGITLYAFTANAVVQSTREAWEIENQALEKRGHARWSIHHRLWRALAAQAVFQGVIFLIGGPVANGVALGGMLIARFWVESFNYFQHYGQVRVAGTPIRRHHVWNHLKPLSRMSAFEITNHADHHLDTYLPYFRLVPDQSAIRLPSVFVCFLTALIPPLWHNVVIKPALKRWDLEFANAEERALARAQNKAAGWEDWFGDEKQVA